MSFLSALLHKISTIRYRRNRAATKPITPKFLVSDSWLNPRTTTSKSIGFGATRKSPPNDVRWVHRHCRLVGEDWLPAWNINEENEISSWRHDDVRSIAIDSIISCELRRVNQVLRFAHNCCFRQEICCEQIVVLIYHEFFIPDIHQKSISQEYQTSINSLWRQHWSLHWHPSRDRMTVLW